MSQKKFLLDENKMPKTWYNIQADLPVPLPPPLHPGTKQPIGPADLEPLFPMELILQEVSNERYIDIPEPIREVYKIYRPSPLIRASGLEKALHRPEIRLRPDCHQHLKPHAEPPGLLTDLRARN